MNDREYVRLGLRILDEQIVDCDGRRCGRVEDLELEVRPGEPPLVSSILCGAAAWKRRTPRTIGRFYGGDPAGLRRVPWDQVTETGNEIHLRLAEAEFARAADSEASELAVSMLIGRRLAASANEPRGRVWDVVGSRPRESEAGVPWELHGLLVGRRGMLQRLGFQPMIDIDLHEGRPPDNLVPWERFAGMDGRGHMLLDDEEVRMWIDERRISTSTQAGSAAR